MRRQEYGRNPTKRKEYVHHPALLLVGVEVSQAKHRACMGTQTTMSCRTLACPPTRAGFRRCEPTRTAPLDQNGRQRILIARAPAGLSWQALYTRLTHWGYAVCLVHCPAGRTKRQTLQDGTSKTDEKMLRVSSTACARAGACCPLPVIRHARPPTA
jgi:hypothetical protein